MAKNIITRIDRNLARRLREARRETGLSTRAVAAKLPRRLSLSHTTIAKYENGVNVPPIHILAALAQIYSRPVNWFLDERDSLSSFRYRNLRSGVGVIEKRRFEALAGKWADAYVKLDQHLKGQRRRRVDDLGQGTLAPEELAAYIRRGFLNLDDDDPIGDTISVLESFSARALELRASFGVDGAAARLRDEFVVVLNPEVANVRVRMNAAHELAHVLYAAQPDDVAGEGELERRAYAFATSLLLPESQLREAFEGRSFLRLIKFKERFGVSLASMIYRAAQTRIINTTASRWLWAQMAHRGWRENEPGYVWRDRAITFEMMLETAIHTKQLTWGDAERITGIREDELQQRLVEVVHTGPASDEEQGEETMTIKFDSAEEGD
ncbi:MAG TPA: ImmA/IrrE family metallo-endopeptidase [Pirellulales bacterium]|nr:ImmA/IrrE family metallo-endopeptidase [Pirellulales bacterium]